MGLNPNFGGNVAGFGQRTRRGQKPQIFPARVKDIVLQPSTNPNSLFALNKGYPSIGYISFHPLYSVVDTDNQANLVAAPMDVNIRRLPLINEIVLIMQSTDILNEDPQAQKFYYLNNVNVWNSIHHNGFPDLQNLNATQKSEVLLGYLSTQQGLTKKPDDTPKDLYLGNTFVEDPQIRNLYPVEGDTIIEGRFGNSIRFSHTSIFPSQSVVSPWSKSGRNTSPITIIRNGQTKATSSIRWTPIFEDIDGDASSIYLTNGQEIQMTLASKNLASYNIAATSSAVVVSVPSVVVQSPNQALTQTDNEELELAASQSLSQTPVAVLTPTSSITSSVTQSQAPNNSTTVTAAPTATVNPTPEMTPTSGPGSSKYQPIPESRLGPLTWAGEEVIPLAYNESYGQIEEDESQYWDKNPTPIEIPKELDKFIVSAPTRITTTGGGGNNGGGGGGGGTTLTPEQLEEALRIAKASGLDIVPGTFYNNNKEPITLAMISSTKTLNYLAVPSFMVMSAAAKADGMGAIPVSSGFRSPLDDTTATTSKEKVISITGQRTLRRDKSRWVGNNKKACMEWGGFTEEAIMKAPSSCYHAFTAPPYKSEHGNGIAIDITEFTGGWRDQLPSDSALKEGYVWMALNGWKYGFVRSVRTETWHFEWWPELAKRGPYVKLSGGKPDKNYQRVLPYKGQMVNLATITV